MRVLNRFFIKLFNQKTHQIKVFALLHRILTIFSCIRFFIHTYIFYVYKLFFSETSCDFNECIQGCQYVKIGLNQGCSEACKRNQTFQKNTTCVDLCKKTSQQFMTSIIGRDLVLLTFLGFKSVFQIKNDVLKFTHF